PAGDASRRGARDVPVARARRAGSRRRRAGVGGNRAPPRGRRLPRRAGRRRLSLRRDPRSRAPLRRARAGARTGARRGRLLVGRARWSRRAEVRGARRSRRGAGGAGARRLERARSRLPCAASALAERLGPDGRRAWGLARGGDNRRVRPRRPPAEIAERLEFLEAVANELTLRRALAVLVERALARPERAGRAVRKLALSARLVGGGSWRRSTTLREPAAEKERLRTALAPKLAELPAPVTALGLEVVELAEWTGQQLELVGGEGAGSATRLKEGLRQARASAGATAV